MALEVWYPADLRNALLAAEQAASATAGAIANQDDPFAAGFLTGYRAALTTLGLAFGLVIARPASLQRQSGVLAGLPVEAATRDR